MAAQLDKLDRVEHNVLNRHHQGSFPNGVPTSTTVSESVSSSAGSYRAYSPPPPFRTIHPSKLMNVNYPPNVPEDDDFSDRVNTPEPSQDGNGGHSDVDNDGDETFRSKVDSGDKTSHIKVDTVDLTLEEGGAHPEPEIQDDQEPYRDDQVVDAGENAVNGNDDPSPPLEDPEEVPLPDIKLNSPRPGSPTGSPGPTSKKSKKKKRKVTFFEPEPEGRTPTPPLPQTVRLPEKLLRQVRIAQSKRIALNQVRNSIIIDRRAYSETRNLFIDTVDNFLHEGLAIMSMLESVEDIDPDTRRYITEAWGAVRNEASYLTIQDRTLNNIEDELGMAEEDILTRDSRLESREEQLLGKYEIRASDPLPSAEVASDDGSLSAHSASSIPEDPLVREYYDRIGEVTLARDHLHNFDTDFMKDLDARESLRQRSIVPSVPEDAFYQDYFFQREKLLHHYVTTKDAVRKLAKICRSNGLTIDDPNLPSDALTSLDQSGRASVWSHRGWGEDSSVGGSAGSYVTRVTPSARRFNWKYSEARVNRWLFKVRNEQETENALLVSFGGDGDDDKVETEEDNWPDECPDFTDSHYGEKSDEQFEHRMTKHTIADKPARRYSDPGLPEMDLEERDMWRRQFKDAKVELLNRPF